MASQAAPVERYGATQANPDSNAQGIYGEGRDVNCAGVPQSARPDAQQDSRLDPRNNDRTGPMQYGGGYGPGSLGYAPYASGPYGAYGYPYAFGYSYPSPYYGSGVPLGLGFGFGYRGYPGYYGGYGYRGPYGYGGLRGGYGYRGGYGGGGLRGGVGGFRGRR